MAPHGALCHLVQAIQPQKAPLITSEAEPPLGSNAVHFPFGTSSTLPMRSCRSATLTGSRRVGIRLQTASSIRCAASQALHSAIRLRCKAGDLLRGQAEAQLSSLFCDLWNRAEREVRALPATADSAA